MSSNLDFPNNCPTNVYTLNDFGEIAYIVCTVAAPPTHDPSAFITSKENTLARLRKTERQFRENSILASLDVEARQLFTFYKKVDITAPKDQKTLLMKFGHVLRSNTCTIAYKTAARLPDLMKPEQARLYRLFITAIVSSIKLAPVTGAALQQVGPNLYLAENISTSLDQDRFSGSKTWEVYCLDLQVLLSGHIILKIVKDDILSFSQIQDFLPTLKQADEEPIFLPVYLAPIGHTGRMLRSSYSRNIDGGGRLDHKIPDVDPVHDARRELWKELLPLWLKEYMSFDVPVAEFPWVEIEVPVEEASPLSDQNSEDVMSENSPGAPTSWKTIFWPANLCFHPENIAADWQNVAANNEDPLQFVQEWLLGANVEPSATGHDLHRAIGKEGGDDPLFGDETTFDYSEHFQQFGPPTIAVPQTIYPTPSDMDLTHPTPGMSSVEGIGMTPSNFPGSSAELPQLQDEEMPDFEDEAPASGVSAYYDEDLFDEMPNDNFSVEPNGDEPNWDFFDSPGGTRKPSRSASHSRKEGSTSRGDPKQEKIVTNEAKAQRTPSLKEVSFLKKESSAPNNIANVPESFQPRIDSGPDELLGVAPSVRIKAGESPLKPAIPLWRKERDRDSASAAASQQRSSVYSGAKLLPSMPRNDSKYAANGNYWFDPLAAHSKDTERSSSSSKFRKRSSSLSENDSSSTDDSEQFRPNSGGHNSPTIRRQWTEYGPRLQSETAPATEIDIKKVRQEIHQLLGLLKPGLLDPPTQLELDLDQKSNHYTSSSSLHQMQYIVQVLVDQITQTSLVEHCEFPARESKTDQAHIDMAVDLRGINTWAASSTLVQLTSLKSDHSGVRPSGRVSRIEPNHVHLRRLDRPLTASMSILAFWETLNLQPLHGPKDVTVFCIHQNSANVRQGSLNLLARLSDAYTTCALGSHTTGQIPGLVIDGSLSWEPEGSSRRTLLQSSTLLGTALGATSNIRGTVMVYMMSRGNNPATYLEICVAFYNLFDSFTKSRSDRSGVTDIQLQIIPRGFVASSETLVVPTPTAYLKLAIEVYNRLPPSDSNGPPAACGSAITVSRAENNVRLQLTPTYSSPLERIGPCLHLAYSTSKDHKWTVAVWTDELGEVALTMCYCSYSRSSDLSRPRQEIFHEMWEVSQDLMAKVRGPWRLAVVKEGFFEPTEILDWQQTHDSLPAIQKRGLLLLLSVQLHPDLRIFPQPTLGKGGQGGINNYYGTPVSTPQASMTSPDQIVAVTPTAGGSSIMNASTPPDLGFDPNAESDLIVVDPSEESWGIVLPFGTNQSRNMTELRPAQITGYLMKRRGPKHEDGYNMIEVSLVRTTAPATNKPKDLPSDELIEDILRQYRGLVTLGVTRGCVDPNRECLPWHLATAMRGARVLEQVM